MKKTTTTTQKKLKIELKYPYKYKIKDFKDLKKIWINKGEYET